MQQNKPQKPWGIIESDDSKKTFIIQSLLPRSTAKQPQSNDSENLGFNIILVTAPAIHIESAAEQSE